MKCKICHNEVFLAKIIKIRKVYDAKYYSCDYCGFMFVGNPTWLDEAYAEPINITDTGYILRNVYLSRKTLVLFTFLFGRDSNFLDFAGGYGVLSRLMRDYGLNFLLTDAYTANLFMKGFEYKNQKIEALTCFECFEHFVFPLKEIEKMLKISKNIFFSTSILPEVIPDDSWEYYGAEHGQHVSFYSQKTLVYIAKKYNLNICSNGTTLHLFTEKKVSNWYFKFLLVLTTIQFDLVVRKMLKSKTTEDSFFLRNM